VAPASREFSTSSFTTEAGLSTTSPAAILETTSQARILIGIAGLFYTLGWGETKEAIIRILEKPYLFLF
jgi:hypothetical protein